MAVRSLTYLDIPATQRRETAQKVLSRLKERLNEPLTTPDQAQALTDRVVRIEQWASGHILKNPEG